MFLCSSRCLNLKQNKCRPFFSTPSTWKFHQPVWMNMPGIQRSARISFLPDVNDSLYAPVALRMETWESSPYAVVLNGISNIWGSRNPPESSVASAVTRSVAFVKASALAASAGTAPRR